MNFLNHTHEIFSVFFYFCLSAYVVLMLWWCDFIWISLINHVFYSNFCFFANRFSSAFRIKNSSILCSTIDSKRSSRVRFLGLFLLIHSSVSFFIFLIASRKAGLGVPSGNIGSWSQSLLADTVWLVSVADTVGKGIFGIDLNLMRSATLAGIPWYSVRLNKRKRNHFESTKIIC